ncbi:MAG: glycosyltransferase [Gammaproteobacteria bacterium]|nr:glycosyltransferase [Gammaproteobacteria bacterium]MBU2435901.1 glycosyltransferase [Gammaproteobacteria bacterium]MBU2449318.1 glycosyltransferase [Gammaproteobacteria bacterium]
MKVEVVSFTGDSGLADYSVSLARALARLVKAQVVSAQSLPVRFDEMGFAVERVFRRSRHYPLDIFRFFFGVLRRRPDWVLIQGPLKFPVIDALVVRVLKLFGIGCAVTVHDVLPHYPRPWSRAEFGFYYRSFSRVIAHSTAAASGLRKLGVATEVLVVPHGIYDIFDLTGINREAARKAIGGIEPDDTVVLFFGHLEPRKGLMEFLDAAKTMLLSDPNVKFLVAGGGSLDSHGTAYAQRLEEARAMPNVIVHDRRIPFEAVENYFAASDIIALPYREGTTSGVLKLALAFGKPVVASRVGDFPEQIPAGAGVLFEADKALARHLEVAIREIAGNFSGYSAAMQAAGGDAQWPDIANRVVNYLKVH